VRQRISALFVYAIAQGIATGDPAEKLGAVLKPLRKGRQPATKTARSLSKPVNPAFGSFRPRYALSHSIDRGERVVRGCE